MSNRFTGLIAAPYTPFHSDGSLNLAVIEKQCEKLVADGVGGAFVCGSTGEGVSLSTAERQAVAQRWVEVAQGRLKVIVHVGHTSVVEAAALAAAAQQQGASAVATTAPFFFKPTTHDHLLDFLAPVAAAAPELPFFYYNIPSMTGVNLPVVPLLERGMERIPNLAGVKFTHNDLMEFAACLRLGEGRFTVLFGMDEWMLPALSLGAYGFIGSNYNYAGRAFSALIAAFRAGKLDEAQTRSDKAMAAIRALLSHPGVPAGKAVMERLGLPVGPPRPPLRPLTTAEGDALFARFQELDFV